MIGGCGGRVGSEGRNGAEEALVKVPPGTDLTTLQAAAIFLYQHRLTLYTWAILLHSYRTLIIFQTTT